MSPGDFLALLLLGGVWRLFAFTVFWFKMRPEADGTSRWWFRVKGLGRSRWLECDQAGMRCNCPTRRTLRMDQELLCVVLVQAIDAVEVKRGM